MSDKTILNTDKPIIFSILNLDTNYSAANDKLFSYIKAMYGDELIAIKDSLKKYKKETLQRAIDYIYERIKKDEGDCLLERIGLITYKEYYTYDIGNNIKQDLAKLKIDISLADFFFAIYWCEIEFIYNTLQNNKHLIFKNDTHQKLTPTAKLLLFVKQSSFTYALGREEMLKNRNESFTEDIKIQSNQMIDNSYKTGGEDSIKQKTSEAGKARAATYKHVKEYITKEYQNIISKTPETLNNDAVHTIIKKMDKENFNYFPVTEYSRVRTFNKWIAKIKKGEEP